jgi:hypothetical protein
MSNDLAVNGAPWWGRALVQMGALGVLSGVLFAGYLLGDRYFGLIAVQQTQLLTLQTQLLQLQQGMMTVEADETAAMQRLATAVERFVDRSERSR